MVSVEEATQIIQSTPLQLPMIKLPIVNSVGRVLAEPIAADRDLPPFDRVSMDGVAFHSSSFQPNAVYVIEGIQPAGTAALKLESANGCIEVMTGATLPEGADVVVRYEDISKQDNRATINLNSIRPGMNIHARASDAAKGEILLDGRQVISPAEISVLASVGRSDVLVFGFPKTAILSSGDELVDIDEEPEIYQIRRSNVYSLQAALLEMGWASDSFHLRDDKEFILHQLKYILATYQVVILSGGVSKGKFDFIPDALAESGVKRQFHNISQRPGKPFWFGTSSTNIVFALPGNPVSTFVCFQRYIKPWVLSKMGVPKKVLTAALTEDVRFTPPLTCFLQVKTLHKESKLYATPVPGEGSGDFVNLKEVDGFIELPRLRSEFKAGEVLPFIPFR